MTGHINLWENFYMACFSISHYLAHLFLRVEERPILLIGPIRAVLQISEIGVFARSTNGGEFGIFLDFQTPTLVVGDMPVEAIELIVGHHVEYFLNLINIEEMTRNVEHKTAIAKARTIRDADNGEWQSCQTDIGYTCTNRGGHQFLQRSQTIEETCGSITLKFHPTGCDVEFVAFGIECAIIARQHYLCARGFVGSLHLQSRLAVEEFNKIGSFGFDAIG